MAPPFALVANVVRFGRLLRDLGLPADPSRTRLFLHALGALAVERRGDVKAAGRTIFTRRREQQPVYDAAFDLFWRRSTAVGGPDRALPRIRQGPRGRVGRAAETGDAAEIVGDRLPIGASRTERLRDVDFAELTGEEIREAERVISELAPRLAVERSRRLRIRGRGRRLAMRATVRRSFSTGGETLDWRWLHRRERPRQIVLICDVSGSMERYTRFLLRFAHAFARCGAPVEVFVFATRLTRITRELEARRPDEALERAARRVVDWSGGTRLGECLRELNRSWLRRTVRSGSVVLLFSDGWERGDPEVLAREMARLQRSCRRLIWLDPLAARPGFQPATAGLRAALPFVDDFLPCATVASLEELARRIGRRLPVSGADRA